MTGRLMFGVGINSDAGLVGSIVLDEQNFDWTRFPTSWEDIRNATAWRGAGQRFRIEAVPGTQVQRYMVTFQEPYMFGSQVSMSLNGYYYNRIYNEYTDQRLGGRIGFGYQFTPALSAGVAYSGAKINITNPIDPLLPDLAEVVGRDLAMHSFQLSLSTGQPRQRLPRHRRAFDRGVDRTGAGLVPVSAGARSICGNTSRLYERPDGSGPARVDPFGPRRLDGRQHADLRPLLCRRFLQHPRLPVPRGVAAGDRPATPARTSSSAATSNCSPRPNTCFRSPPTTWSAA